MIRRLVRCIEGLEVTQGTGLGALLKLFPWERRFIRGALRDAYDTASKAVHEGELPKAMKPTLSTAQDLCRRGILKLLREGPPDDWGDLLLGAELR